MKTNKFQKHNQMQCVDWINYESQIDINKRAEKYEYENQFKLNILSIASTTLCLMSFAVLVYLTLNLY